MTFGILILCALGLVLVLYRFLENRVNRMSRQQKHTEDRISSLEVKDYGQDFRLDAQDRRIGRLHTDVKELGRDIGWSDERQRTQVVKKKTPSDDDASGNT